ncbi:hypothetical protein B0H10DRAFT_431154 [Mycena sp. CBHHK59/15]|nr:hypothetical protein B0H10DRAFT_431154 [Mycena sp. CBHHK59/15]
MPAHLQPKATPPSRGIQIVNTPVPQNISTGSGLSTKQRLGQAALAPINPKETTKKSLSSLSFRKKTDSSGPAASGSIRPVNRPPPPKRPPPARDPLFGPDPDEDSGLVEPPVDMHNDMDDGSMLLPALSRRRSQTSHSHAQAENFLKDIMPPSLAAPLMPTIDKHDGPSLPRPLVTKTKMPPLKIQKKWKWSGKFLVDVADKTEHLCDVVMNDLVPPLAEGMGINVAMASADSVHLLSFHDLMDMREFLKTCITIDQSTGERKLGQQLARLGPSFDKDIEPLRILARYMTKKQFVSLVPVKLDGDLVGHILFFPPIMKILITMLGVPPELQQNSSLVAALLPWKPFPEESRRPFGLLPAHTSPLLSPPVDWKKNLTKSNYQLALRILKFPTPLFEWMSKSNRPYCIWSMSSERKGPHDRETGYLISILNQCGVTRVGFKAEIRAVFVHVGALKDIHKMPLLVERRSRTLSIRFFTYGTHETVHPEQWGVREIYPLGGIVTFTPDALYEDPWGMISKMKIIDQHPLWTCYILPSVFGMAIKLSGADEDPLAAFDRGLFVFERLLNAIDAGEVSLLRAPPVSRNAMRTADPTLEWLRDHWITRPLGPRQVLEYCVNAFSTKYSNIPRSQWASTIETEISEDLRLVQLQPDIMRDYRRFVVIRAETEQINADKDGLEWVTNSGFAFNDDTSPDKF